MSENKISQKKKKTINGHEIEVVLFPGGPGFELLFELKNIMGESIGSLFGGEIEVAIAKLGGNLSKKEGLDFILRLLEWTYIDGRTQGVDKLFFDEHFAGRYGHLFKVIAFVTEVNFGDFFDEMRRGLVATVTKLGKGLEAAGATNLDALSSFQTASGIGGQSSE